MVTSGSVAGAETMTFFAPPFSMCWMTSGRLVYLPVDSMTTSTPRSFQGSLPTSFSARTLIFRPLTTMASPSTWTSPLKRAEDRVVLQQMGQRLGVGDVVRRDDLDGRVAGRRPENVAADAAESVDADLDAHEMPPWGVVRKRKFNSKYHNFGPVSSEAGAPRNGGRRVRRAYGAACRTASAKTSKPFSARSRVTTSGGRNRATLS